MKEHVAQTTPKRIKCIQFGVLSKAEIQALSHFEVTEGNLYNPEDRTPVRFGVLDRRLGVSQKDKVCETCGLPLAECIGHYAHIDLPLPIFHVGFFKATFKTLQSICKSCSRLLLEEGERRKYLSRLRRPRIDNVQKMTVVNEVIAACKKVVYCPYCYSSNGAMKKVGPLKLVHEKFRHKPTAEEKAAFYKTFDSAVANAPDLKPHIARAQEDMHPLRVYQLFQQIPSEDCELLGFDPQKSRPEQFLWTSIPVPPACIRPSVIQDGGSNEDDLTQKLSEILFAIKLIKETIDFGLNTSLLIERWEFLQLSAATYITFNVPGFNPMQNNMKPTRGFCERLKGKTGRFRGNLSGKRVDFSGRTVISPDPNLRIDQIAVPELIAKLLTYPERVTSFNLKKLQLRVLNGPTTHPGANFVEDSKGIKRFLKVDAEKRQSIAKQLRVGDIVYRHLSDNDIVLFNRQPSLHRLSIMAHLVKVRPWRTLRFNECVCNPYNADFDGDEMNLHVPQTEEARIEAYELMGVKNNLVTPRNGEPLIAAIQDFITASYLLTKKDRFYDRSQFTQICSFMDDALLPIDLPPPTILKPVRLWTGKQIFNVLIRPTRKSPILVNLESKCRSYAKPPPKFLPDMCINDGYLVIRNSEVMCGVMDKATVGDGNKNSLFYVILRDYGAVRTAECMNRLAKLCCRWLGNHGFSLGINDVMPGTQLLRRKHDAITTAYRQCDELIHQHRIGQLTPQAGCDEDQTLEAQISGKLSKVRDEMGQVCIDELNKYNAPLTMALCGSKGSKINVCQMVACVGQQIISGSRIPDGFEDRSLPHFLKKSKIPAAKGFVRNSFYSGLTPTEFFFHAISGREGLVDTAVKTAETGYMQRRLIKALEDLTTQYDLSVRNSEGVMVQFCYGDDGLDPLILEGNGIPVEFDRNLAHVLHTNPPAPEDHPLLPHDIVLKTDQILARAEFVANCNAAFLDSVRAFVLDKVAVKVANLRAELGLSDGLNEAPMEDAPDLLDQVNQRYCVYGAQLERFLEVCRVKYIKAKVEPGTAVGAIGAQSIGEPGTQMTLKTFHFAGVASMNVTLGVPRIGEIINAAKRIATPIITCKLVNDASEISARIVKARVERTTLGDVAEFIEEVYQPEYCYLGVRIDFNAIRLLQLEVTLAQIADAVAAAPKLKLSAGLVTCHPPNKLRISVPNKDPAQLHFDIQHLKRQLAGITIKGFPDVRRAVISLDNRQRYNLLVEGYGLLKVMTTQGIVGTQTTSNHIMEVKDVLGIEAARNTIIHEIQYTMSTHGMTIDPRHVMLLGDVMTFKGDVLGITRDGIKRMKDSVLMLASFERTSDHLFDAALYSRRDTIEGVSECIIMGITMPIGTGLFKLLQSHPKPLPPPRALLFDDPALHLPLAFA